MATQKRPKAQYIVVAPPAKTGKRPKSAPRRRRRSRPEIVLELVPDVEIILPGLHLPGLELPDVRIDIPGLYIDLSPLDLPALDLPALELPDLSSPTLADILSTLTTPALDSAFFIASENSPRPRKKMKVNRAILR